MTNQPTKPRRLPHTKTVHPKKTRPSHTKSPGEIAKALETILAEESALLLMLRGKTRSANKIYKDLRARFGLPL